MKEVEAPRDGSQWRSTGYTQRVCQQSRSRLRGEAQGMKKSKASRRQRYETPQAHNSSPFKKMIVAAAESVTGDGRPPVPNKLHMVTVFRVDDCMARDPDRIEDNEPGYDGGSVRRQGCTRWLFEPLKPDRHTEEPRAHNRGPSFSITHSPATHESGGCKPLSVMTIFA